MENNPLLRYCSITDKNSYHRWCLENHPDKNPNDPDATRKFQEVQAEYRKYPVDPPCSKSYTAPRRTEPAPKPKSSQKPPGWYKPSFQRPKRDAFWKQTFNMFARAAAAEHEKKNKCTHRLATSTGFCHRPKHTGYETCFYHIQDSNNERFLDYIEDLDTAFGPFNAWASKNCNRDTTMCTKKTSKEGTYCRLKKCATSNFYCSRHCK